MKIKALLVAVLVMFVITTVHAQISVSSTPRTSIRANGKAEKVGNIVLTFNTAPANATDSITMDLGAPASVASATATVSGGSGITAGTMTTSGNIVTLPLTYSSASTGNIVTVSGLRVNMSGSTATSLSATLATSSVGIVAGQNTTKIVNAVGTPTSAGASTDAKAAILDDGSSLTATGQLTVTEGFASAWATSAQEGTTGVTQGHQLKLILAGTLPTGVKLNLTTKTSSTVSGVVTYTPATLSSSAKSSIITFDNTNTALKEKLYILFTPAVTTSGTGKITKPLASASFTATVQDDPTSSTKVPYFVATAVPTGGQIVLNIVTTTTNIMYTFTTWDATLNFDTGLAVANTSSDPFSVNGATATAGTITYNFYPRGGGASYSYATTAGSPGTGLEADGTLAAGGTHTVLVSELVAAASQTGPFTGYIIAVCGFTHGHGEGYVLDGTVIAQTINGLVIPEPGQATRKTPGSGESLGR